MKKINFRKRILSLFLVLWGCLMSFYLPAQNVALNNFVKNTGLKYAGIGIKVVEVETGKVVCAYNDNLSLTPASTLKTLTTASALELFGPSYRYNTSIAYDGTINNRGILEGNLYIIGSGDPTLGSSYFSDDKNAFLKIWKDTIQNSGIKSITGDIISIDNLFGYEGVSNRWIWGDIGNYYASATYGISVFDNTYLLYLKSGAAKTTPVVLYTDPEITGLTFNNQLQAAANSSDSAYIYGIPLSYDRRLYGSIPANKSSFSIKGDIPDPGLLLVQTLSDYLQKNGIQLLGKATTCRLKTTTPTTKMTELYTHRGNSLDEIIKITNFRSNNHFAEHLFYKIGWDKDQACTTHVPTLAANRISSFWRGKGIDTQGLFQYDGSGLSNADAITASMLTSVLVYMQKQSKYADVFYRSLPTAGKEGTVKSFLNGSKLDGKAHIKSGSISGVQAYTGYVDKNGKRYAFTILVNRFTGSRNTLKNQMENFLVSF